MTHVFVSYVRENESAVDKLCAELRREGVEVWLDREAISPGDRWRSAIRRAIQEGAYFIACFSAEFAKRDKTYMNEELTVAIDELRQRPTDRVWFIPVLLSSCKIPDREIGGGESLRDLQWVSLLEDWPRGMKRILGVVAPGRAADSDKTPTERFIPAFIGGAATGAALNELGDRLAEEHEADRSPRGVNISTRHYHDVVILDISGRLTIGEGDAMLREAVKDVLDDGARKVLLNLAGVRMMDSSGLGELVRTRASAQEAGAVIKLLHVEDRLREVLEMTRLIGVFETFDDENGALSSFRS